VRLTERLIFVSGLVLSNACSDGGDTNGAGNDMLGTGGSSAGAPSIGTGGSAGSTVMGNGGVTGTGSGGVVVVPGSGGKMGGAGTSTMGGAPSGGASGASGASGAAGSSGGGSGAGGGGGSSGGGGVAGQSGGGGQGGALPPGMCCSDGKCLCHGDPPSALTAAKGPYKTTTFTIAGVGCVHYPTDAPPPYAGLTVSDGFSGSGGCNSVQTGQWGPLYASWGIVAMIIDTGASDPPPTRGTKLGNGITALKAENTKMGSPLMGKMAGRWATSGFSMGGGGTTVASQKDPTLLSSVAIMAWQPVTSGIKVPTLFICGSSDTLAGCGSMGTPSYNSIAEPTSKMRVTISSGHAGQPSSGSGKSGQFGLAWMKLFLEGDTRWKPLLTAAMVDATNLK
jgi:hypothetical protein